MQEYATPLFDACWSTAVLKGILLSPSHGVMFQKTSLNTTLGDEYQGYEEKLEACGVESSKIIRIKLCPDFGKIVFFFKHQHLIPSIIL